MNITIIGTGYVGLVTGACFAELGINVCCLDNDIQKISNLENGILPIYEPGLKDLVIKNYNNGSLTFSTDKSNLDASDILMIAVGTPESENGSASMRYVHAVVDDICSNVSSNKIVIVKSTVPVGTAKELQQLFIKKAPNISFDIVSNPEFLREGYAVHDAMSPDRVVIGTNNSTSKKALEELYRPFEKKNVPIVFTDNQTAELIKYTANCYLAMRIGFINEIADLCESVGANVTDVAKGVGLDNRIGLHYLQPGPGFGGSCFPKDTKALTYIARQYNANSKIIETVIDSNDKRKKGIACRVLQNIPKVKDPVVAVLGLAFKANTDDMRDSASIDIINTLLDNNVSIQAYDPEAHEEAYKIFGDRLKYSKDSYEACVNAHLVVIVTEWPEFVSLDLKLLAIKMTSPNLVDLRLLYSQDEVKEAGFVNYDMIGK